MYRKLENAIKESAQNVPKVYESGVKVGKQAERNAFWDVLQNYGSEVGQNYNGAFAYERLTDAIYNPIHPIITTTSSTAAQTIFIYSVITDTKVPIICQGSRMNQTFAYSSIQKIPELNVHENVVFDRTFVSASGLEELNITGTIGQNGFNVQWSKNLNKASIRSIVNALSATTSGLTVTLSQTAVNNAFTAEEWDALEATKTNWTISLA